ncbi:MAG: hypothetical protein ACK4MF_07885 [Hyphomicrobiaceae bacterium]
MMKPLAAAKTRRPENFAATAATVLLAAAAVAAGATLARAEQPTSVTSAGAGDIELTAEEIAEKEARKSCKVAICAGFRNPSAAPADISCTVPKSWRKAQLDKMVSKAKVSWPWGPVSCNAAIKLDRDALAKAMTDDKSELKLATQSVDCRIANEGAEPTKVSVEFAPTVSFEKGQAVKAQINWGKLEAPTLVKGLMWTATGTDNTLNVLQSTLVTDINDFIGKKCDEVKDDWSK